MNSSSSSPNRIELDPHRNPKHVAIIMDGNGRWAKKRLLNRINGHEKGADAVREVVQTARKINISTLTLFAFSTENWQRPKTEVSGLMVLLRRFLESERKTMLEKGIRLNTIGQMERLPESVCESLQSVMNETSGNSDMVLNLALSYGARAEILQMTQKLARAAKEGTIDPADITDETIADHLYTQGMPDVDLLIRTSGELRISNFLLWQIAYAELFFTKTLWPDFGEEEFLSIIKAYQERDRRFGTVR